MRLLLLLAWQVPCALGGEILLTNAGQASVEAAIKETGTIKFGFDGTIALTNHLLIAADVTLDASGRSIAFDGQNRFRHFVVTNGATLRLINLTLMNGRFVGPDGATGEDGFPGMGGSIWNAGGELELAGCHFLTNRAAGGNGGASQLVGPSTWNSPAGQPGYGGAIYCSGGSLKATHCIFINNSSAGGHGQSGGVDGIYTGAGRDAFGGAVCVSNAVASLDDVTFMDNSAAAGDASAGRANHGGGRSRGGALASLGGRTALNRCVFKANRAVGTRQSNYEVGTSGCPNGGAVYLETGEMNVSESWFTRNTAVGGGGLARGSGAISAYGLGGAVYVESGTLTLSGSTLDANLAQGGNAMSDPVFITTAGDAYGGALYTKGSVMAVNCTFATNSASAGGTDNHNWIPSAGGSAYGGAAAVAQGGTLSLLNVTLAGNRAIPSDPPRGGLAFGNSLWAQSGSALALTNTILACAFAQTNVSGALIDGGHNLCSDTSAIFTAQSSRNNIDPMLNSLAFFAGSTPTMPLLPSSPAVDSGDPSVAPSTDQRGVRRPQGRTSDIGAFELSPQLTMLATNGVVTVQNVFLPGETNLLLGSFNLIEWEMLQQKLSDQAGATQFEDGILGQFPHRFYQVRTIAAPSPSMGAVGAARLPGAP